MNQKTLFSFPSFVKDLSLTKVHCIRVHCIRVQWIGTCIGLAYLCGLAFSIDAHAKRKPYCSRGKTHIGCSQMDEDGCCLKGAGQKGCEVGRHRLGCRTKNQDSIGCCPDTSRQEQQRKKAVNWIFIEGGKFKMGAIWGEGDEDELPQHWVKIESLYVSKNEITVRQYAQCVKMGVCSLPQQGGNCNWGISKRQNHPVNCVTWNQARIYAHWVGGDLPSEAQWEYIARNRGYNHAYPWGSKPPTCEHALLLRGLTGCHGQDHTDEVCKRPQGNSELGVCDLLGNVSEWTLDMKFPYTDQTATGRPRCIDENCTEKEASNRIIRGGGWDDPPQRINVTYRGSFDPQYQRYNVGIRPIRFIED
jgi:iron(II)-dependent oxidoreductase